MDKHGQEQLQDQQVPVLTAEPEVGAGARGRALTPTPGTKAKAKGKTVSGQPSGFHTVTPPAQI